MNEQWRPVVGWEGSYEVSNLGRVRGVTRIITFSNGAKPRVLKGTLIKPFPMHTGYLKVAFNRHSRKKNKTVHRLVAEAFIPNPENKPHINHLDGDKTNNRVDNLEWCTRVENMRHCHEVLKKGSRPKRPIRCVETGETYESLHAAARAKNILVKNLPRSLKKGRTTGGFHWEYIEAKSSRG